jgi:hypothetical protein
MHTSHTHTHTHTHTYKIHPNPHAPPQDSEGRPGRGALQLARRKLRLLSYQRSLRDAVEIEADELARARATARPMYLQVRPPLLLFRPCNCRPACGQLGSWGEGCGRGRRAGRAAEDAWSGARACTGAAVCLE